MRRDCCFLLMLVLAGSVFLSPPTPALAQSAFSTNPYIQRGLSFYNDQKFDQATAAFLKVNGYPRSTLNDRIQAYKYLGFINVILKRQDRAQKYFLDLLRLNPKFRLNNVLNPPKFVRFFNNVVVYYKSQREVKITSLTPDQVPTNETLVVRLKVRDGLRRVARLELRYRLENAPRYFQRNLKETQPPQQAAPVAPAVRPAPKVQPAPKVRPAARPAVRPAVRPAARPAARPAPAAKPAARKDDDSKDDDSKDDDSKDDDSKDDDSKDDDSKDDDKDEDEKKPKNRAKGKSPSIDRFYSYKVPTMLFANVESGQAYYFEFYVVAYDKNNKRVANLGTPNKPVQIKRIYVEKKKTGPKVVATPFYKTWWFWTITGVAVAGVATAIVVPLVINQPPPTPTTGEAIITIVR